MRRRESHRPVPLAWRAQQLADALDQGGEQLDPALVAQGRALVRRVAERGAIGTGRTVVALAGATGSGKSTLFNRLVGDEVAPVGVRRPTTDRATAGVWGREEAEELLDWLDVRARHHVAAGGTDGADGAGDLDGLVLVDLPDFDSVEVGHWAEADRVLQRADVFLWVTDPQKYADARLHDDYLRPLQDHETVMIVLLNQVDRVPELAVPEVSADLARLVAADGAGDLPVLPVSARTGDGVDRVRRALADVVAERNAAEARLTGDIRGLARRLLEGLAEEEPTLDPALEEDLVLSLGRAAGVPVVLDAVERDYRRQSVARGGWVFTRWLRGLRAGPLERLRLGGGERSGHGRGERPFDAADVRAVLGRSSLPPATPAARSAVRLATQATADHAGAGLPPRWRLAVSEAADPDETALADALDQAVLATPLRARTPLWWPLLGGLQVLLALSAVAGAAWLAVLAGLGWLQLPADAPSWGPLPVPLVLLVGGLLLGMLIGVVARVAGRIGARRRRRAVERELRRAVIEVARRHVRGPVNAVLERHRHTRSQLAAAAR